MFKYLMTAAALKMFSISPQTKRFYRLLGNILDQRRRIQEGLNEYYVDRARKILELCERHNTIQKGNRLLEIGTGWMHWESMIIRLKHSLNVYTNCSKLFQKQAHLMRYTIYSNYSM